MIKADEILFYSNWTWRSIKVSTTFTPFLPPTDVLCFWWYQTALCPAAEGLPEMGRSRSPEGSSEPHRSRNPDQELYWCTDTPAHTTQWQSGSAWAFCLLNESFSLPVSHYLSPLWADPLTNQGCPAKWLVPPCCWCRQVDAESGEGHASDIRRSCCLHTCHNLETNGELRIKYLCTTTTCTSDFQTM